ncbi:GAF and ANTAR domain-containing protein [Rhodococcus sp. X156]|uniref:GAF and ANTAR domain-containing protein n=1 Tax=Rhodococcus sp. X156 TaxID=2499145 RepID=UPI0013E3CD0A|nr:GAF and ANTAR domain-containing protein [Rhodococcus sp. X156]
MTNGIHLASDELGRLLAARPKEMADVLSTLRHPVHTNDDLLDLLTATAHLAVRLIDGADWSGVTAQFDKSAFTAALTDERVQAVDDAQYHLDDGPCLQAMRTCSVVCMSARDVQREFPAMAEPARAAGVHSFLAAPLVAEGVAIGALNLYSAEEHGFEGTDQDFIAALVEHAGRGLTEYATVHSANQLAAQLQHSIQTRAPIEQAKGILMAVHQIGPDAAFEVLRERSMKQNIKLRDVAISFIAEIAAATATSESAQ